MGRAVLRTGIWSQVCWALCLGLSAVSPALPAESLPSAVVPLTNTAQIKRLGMSEALAHLPVELDGVITAVDPIWRFAFLQDDTSAVFMDLRGRTNQLTAGQRVRVSGVTDPGQYAPMVMPDRIEILGRGRLPAARRTSMREMLGGWLDSHFVEVEGVIQEATLMPGAWMLLVSTASGNFTARLPGAPANVNPQTLVDCVVRVRGCVGVTFNQQRQLVGATLVVPTLSELIIDQPSQPRDTLPLRPLAGLWSFQPEARIDRRVRVTGQVTHQRPGHSLMLEEAGMALFVRTTFKQPLAPGTRVDVAGFPAIEAGKAILVHADCLVVDHAPAPAPRQTAVDELQDGTMDGRLVSVEGTVLDDGVASDGEWMLGLQAGKSLLTIHLYPDSPADIPRHLPAGCGVRITGVCWNEFDERLRPAGVRLLARSADDFEIIHSPPWWTNARLTVAMGLLGLFGLGATLAAWIFGRLAQQHRRTERRLQQQENFVRRLLDTIPNFIGVKDREGRFTYVNSALAALCGRPPQELVGRRPQDIPGGAGLLEFSAEEERTLFETLQPQFCAERRFTQSNGQDLWVQVVKQPLIGAQGRADFVLDVGTDITARRQAEQRLRDSEGLYQSLVQHLPISLLRKDCCGRFVFANATCLKALGRTPDQVLGLTDFELFPEVLARKYREDDLRVIETGDVLEAVENHRTPDGQDLVVQVLKAPVRDAQGQIAGIQVMFWDVSERERDKRLLAYERDLFRKLMDGLPDSIYFKDRQSRFVRVSRALAERFHFSEADLAAGKTDFDFFTEQHAREAFEDEQRIMRTGKAVVGKVEKEVDHEGRVTWALTTKMPWRSATGEVIGTFGVSQDLTPLKEAEQRAEQAQAQLVEASRKAGMAEVATNVLHNVGNVLNSVMVSVSVIRNYLRRSKVAGLKQAAGLLTEHSADLGRYLSEDARGRQLCPYLQQLADHLIQEQSTLHREVDEVAANMEHIKEIVATQQAYAGRAGVLEHVSLADLTEDAVRLQERSLARHDVKLVRDYGTLPTVTVDRHKVFQILLNLLSNAKHACGEGGSNDKQVTVRVSRNGGNVARIEVTDNGVGIAPENLTRIFSHGFTTRKNGHGFGLHSAALAAKELGGRLTAHSEGPGKGASFVLEIPFTPEATPAVN